MKKLVGIRMSEATRIKLAGLLVTYGTQSEAVAIALEKLWQEHNRGAGGGNDGQEGYEKY